MLSHLSGRQVEAFYVLLVSSGSYTFLPELYDIFGRDATIKFLEVFQGCRLSVPKAEKLEKLAREVGIYTRVERAPTSKSRAVVIQRLAEEYELTEDRVRSIYARIKVKIEDELGFKAIKKYNV